MAKKKKPVGMRTDIPLMQRMQLQKQAEIAAHREDAAQTALKIACVALNDTEGLGFKRICRFALRLKSLTDEYYSSPEIGEHHLNKRLEAMGFTIGPEGQVQAVIPEEVAESGKTDT